MMPKLLTKIIILSSSTGLIAATGVAPLVLSINANSYTKDEEAIPLNNLDIDGDNVLHGLKGITVEQLLYKGYTKLVIPYTVKKIAPYAFAYMFDGKSNNINTIEFELNDGQSDLEEIGDSAFNYCYGIWSPLNLPPNLKIIGKQAFYYCAKLPNENFTIPASITKIGGQAFYGCSSMSGTLGFANTNVEIERYAFENCTGFDTLDLSTFPVIPNWLLENYGIFHDFAKSPLSGNEAQVIVDAGLSAGEDWKNYLVNSQLLPETVKVVEYKVTTKDDFTFDSQNPQTVTGFRSAPENFDFIKIPEDVTKIADGAFQNKFVNCFASLSLPENITEIGKNAFSGCSGIHVKDLKLPVKLQTVGEAAFKNCKHITGKLEIPANLTVFNADAFNNLGIDWLVMHEDMKEFKDRCFANNLYLKTIDLTNIPASKDPKWKGPTDDDKLPFLNAPQRGYFYHSNDYVINIINEFVAMGITKAVTNWKRNDRQTTYRDEYPEHGYLYLNNGNKLVGLDNIAGNYGRLTIPAKTRYIAKKALTTFANPYNLVLNDGLIEIGQEAFSENGVSKKKLYGPITIPNTVKTIGNDAFRSCSNLGGTLNIPKSVVTIGDRAFNSTGIHRIKLTPTLEKIGSEAFRNCSELYEIDLTEFSESQLSKLLDTSFFPTDIFPDNSAGTFYYRNGIAEETRLAIAGHFGLDNWYNLEESEPWEVK